jgi:transposase
VVDHLIVGLVVPVPDAQWARIEPFLPDRTPADEPEYHAIGRFRGGLTTKIHPVTDDRCRPLAFVLTAGQAGDAPAFEQVMSRLRVPRQRGRPHTTPDVVLADKAHSSRAIEGTCASADSVRSSPFRPISNSDSTIQELRPRGPRGTSPRPGPLVSSSART